MSSSEWNLRRPVAWLVVLGLIARPAPHAASAGESAIRERIRRPVAIVPTNFDSCLAVLNRRSGSISQIDARTHQVLNEWTVAHRIAAGCRLAGGEMAIVDDQTNELLVVRWEGNGPRVAERHPVSAAAVNVVVSPDGQSCVVASSWARQLTVFAPSLPPAQGLEQIRTIDLPFAPRLIVFRDNQHVLVADAFGGGLALVDLKQGVVVRDRELNTTHNIAGMTLSDDRATVYLSHQMLHGDQATTQPNVHWGDVMSNVVRRFQLDWFVSDQPEQTTAADLYYLGYPDSAAGDPGGITTTESGQFVVMLAGVNQVAISDGGLNHFRRLDVGRRPLAWWLDAPRHELFIANHFDDSITVIDLKRTRALATFPLGPPGVLSLADKGEQMFYDARLSSDGWYSCHSCHTDGHSNGQRSDTFGDGYRGAPKQVPSLLGTAETPPWSWNGKMPMLEAQIGKSLETTMCAENVELTQVQALAAHLMSLRPPPSRSTARGRTDTAAVARGRRVFQELGCSDCHQPPRYTSSDVYDVGLKDIDGHREFNPPSLLGVGHRRRLLHDGRASDLQGALLIHPFGSPVQLDDQREADLQEFLLSL